MKRTLLFFFAFVLALIPTGIVSAAAQGEDRIILYENFERMKTVEEAKEWYGIEGKNTIRFSVKDGQLVLDNTGDGALESYYVIVANAVMKPHLNEVYNICYDVILDEVGTDTSKYANIIYNYDEYDNYNSVHLRWRGNGNNQIRFGGSWYTFDSKENPGLYLAATDETAFIKTIFGMDYLPETNNVGGKTMSVRLHIDPKAGCTVYLNDIKVSETADDTWWNINEDYGAIAIKIRPGVLARMDNILVYTGEESVTPNAPVHPDPVKGEESSPTADTTATPDTTTATPDTTKAPPDTTKAAPDTTKAAPDTTKAAPDTIASPSAGESTSPNTTGGQNDTDAVGGEEDGSSTVGIVIGVIAAVVVVGAIAWYVISSMKKK